MRGLFNAMCGGVRGGMVIRGHRYSKSTCGANNYLNEHFVFSLDINIKLNQFLALVNEEINKKMYQPELFLYLSSLHRTHPSSLRWSWGRTEVALRKKKTLNLNVASAFSVCLTLTKTFSSLKSWVFFSAKKRHSARSRQGQMSFSSSCAKKAFIFAIMISLSSSLGLENPAEFVNFTLISFYIAVAGFSGHRQLSNQGTCAESSAEREGSESTNI